MTRYYNAV